MPNTSPDERAKEQDHHDSFQRFCESWFDRRIEEFDVVSEPNRRQGYDGGAVAMDSLTLNSRVALHYELYYKSMAMWSSYHEDSVPEGSFIWVGGWRPALAFHVLYSKSGAQMKARLKGGVEIGDLGDLSESQLRRLDALRIESAMEEDEITDKIRVMHEKAADAPMEGLSELIKAGVPVGDGMCDMLLTHSLESLLRVWNMGDELRMSTLMRLADILTRLQFAHFLISAHEMKLGIHEWVQSRGFNNQARGSGGGGADHGQEDHQQAGENSRGGDRDQEDNQDGSDHGQKDDMEG